MTSKAYRKETPYKDLSPYQKSKKRASIMMTGLIVFFVVLFANMSFDHLREYLHYRNLDNETLSLEETIAKLKNYPKGFPVTLKDVTINCGTLVNWRGVGRHSSPGTVVEVVDRQGNQIVASYSSKYECATLKRPLSGIFESAPDNFLNYIINRRHFKFSHTPTNFYRLCTYCSAQNSLYVSLIGILLLCVILILVYPAFRRFVKSRKRLTRKD